MSYRVIAYFTDLQDNNYAYHTGDKFPREGMDVKPSRLVELAGTKNKQGKPLIEAYTEKVEEVPEEKTEDITETDEPKKRGRRKGTDNGNDAN